MHEPAGGVQGRVLEVPHRVQERMREEDSEEEELQEEVQEGQEEVQEDLRPLRSLVLCRAVICATKKIGESERKRLTDENEHHPECDTCQKCCEQRFRLLRSTPHTEPHTSGTREEDRAYV